MDGLYELLQKSPFKMNGLGGAPVLKNIFRRDIFEKVTSRPVSPAKNGFSRAAELFNPVAVTT